MNENDFIRNELNYFASHHRAFCAHTVRDFSTEPVDPSKVRQHLLTDDSFIHIPGSSSLADLFISAQTLLRWLVALNIRLAAGKLSQLNSDQFFALLTSLLGFYVSHDRLSKIISYAKPFGLIYFIDSIKQYFFPLARILSFGPIRRGRFFEILLSAIDSIPLSFEDYMIQTLESSMSLLEPRERHVLCARYGLMGEQQRTLLDIANSLGLTRERVRQIQITARKQEVLFTPFLTALLRDIVRRKGSLLYSLSARESHTRAFFARCLGIPFIIIEKLDLILLGVSQISLSSLDPPDTSLDIRFVVKQLESDNSACLLDTDLNIIANSLIAVWRRDAKITDKLYLALKHIGKPAHFSEIADMYNSLFPENPNAEGNLHNALLRGEHGVVWAGAKGMFALSEWGYKKLTRTLLETVAHIVEQQYNKTHKPVSYEFIVTEFGKYRQLVNPSSLMMSIHSNPNVTQVRKEIIYSNSVRA